VRPPLVRLGTRTGRPPLGAIFGGIGVLAAVVVAAWALADLVLLPSRRSLDVAVSPPLGLVLRVGALVLFLANWVYLMAAGR
jgi:hypothetical protein